MSVGRILLVEDNPDDIELTLRAFRKHDLVDQVDVVTDGQQALAHLTSELPAVVLLDLELPRVSGLEVLRRLRADARTQTLPVVVLTSSMEDRDVRQSYALGANSYIQKPVDFAQFAEAARCLGVYWLVLNRTPER